MHDVIFDLNTVLMLNDLQNDLRFNKSDNKKEYFGFSNLLMLNQEKYQR
jgi:hypothetical protein